MITVSEVEKIENLLKLGTYKTLYRVNFLGQRIYVQTEPFAYYSGLTGALDACTFKGDPGNKRIKNWREGMIDSYGQKNLDNYFILTADFGTLVHTALLTIKEKGLIDWAEESDKAFEYFVAAFKTKQIEPNAEQIRKMVYDYQKHVASLMQFCYERVQEIYAIETPAILEHYKIATPIDLYCLCKQTDKGDFAKTTINIKTSTSISDHQTEQVCCELAAWNETYLDNKANFTAILRTKYWNDSKTPTYEYKYYSEDESVNITNNVFKRLGLCLLSQASYYPNPIYKRFEGVTKIGEVPKIIIRNIEDELTSINTN